MKTATVFGVTALLGAAVQLGGCGQAYTTPGAPADFARIGLTKEDVRAQTDPVVREALAKKPMLVFPTSLAVVRVQSAEYGSQGWRGDVAPYGGGNYTVITTRDVETDADFDRIRRLPQLTGVAPLKRILLPSTLQSDLELRAAAVKLHAGLLMYYTFDTKFYTDEKVAPLTALTLGIAPNRQANVTATASAVLMDAHNGYVYGVYEATSSGQQLANAWTSAEAVDEVRKKAEREAFAKLVDTFTNEWANVVATYTPRQAATQ